MLPDLQRAAVVTGHLNMSFSIATGKEDDTEEACMNASQDDCPTDDTEQLINHMRKGLQDMSKEVLELDKDNKRLRLKCKSLMQQMFDLGHTPQPFHNRSRDKRQADLSASARRWSNKKQR